MFKTFTNLQTNFPLIVDSVTLVNNNKEYICYQVDFNSLEDKKSFGRVLLKLVLRNFTSNVNMVLEKLYLTSIDNLNEFLKDENVEAIISQKTVKKEEEDTVNLEFNISYLMENATKKESGGYVTCFRLVISSSATYVIDTLNKNTDVIIEGEIRNYSKEFSLHKLHTIDIENGSIVYDLFNNDRYINYNLCQTKKLELSFINTKYKSGLLGYNTLLSYEIEAKKTNDYIAISLATESIIYYMKLSKSEAQEKYDIILTSDYGYVDLNDCSYIEYNNNSLILTKGTSTYKYSTPYLNETYRKIYISEIKSNEELIEFKWSSDCLINIESNIDRINISYNSNKLINKINYNIDKEIVVEYKNINNNYLINKLTYQRKDLYDSNAIVLRIYNFNYDSNKLITSIMNNLNDGITINDKEVIQYINNLQVNKNEYSGNREIIVKDRASEITYYLDNEGKCYKTKQDNKYSVINYMPTYIGCSELVSSSYDNLSFTNNLIENPMFYLNESSPYLKWYTNPSDQNIKFVKGYEYLGVKTLKIRNAKLKQYYLYQNVRVSDMSNTDKYYFSCLLKANGDITLKVVYNNVLIKSKTFTLTNEFEEITLEDIIIEPVSDVSYFVVQIETELEEIELSNCTLTRNERKGQVNYFYSNNYEEGPYVSEIEMTGGPNEVLTLMAIIDNVKNAFEVYGSLKVYYRYKGEKEYKFYGSNFTGTEDIIVSSIKTIDIYDKVVASIDFRSLVNKSARLISLTKDLNYAYYDYNIQNKLNNIQDGSIIQTITYDKMKVKRMLSNSEIYTYTYDDSDKLISISDEDNQTIEYEYDELNNITKTTFTDSFNKKDIKETEYDKRSNLILSKDINNIECFKYDEYNRLLQSSTPYFDKYYYYNKKDQLDYVKYYDLKKTVTHNYKYNSNDDMSELEVDNNLYKVIEDEVRNKKIVTLNNHNVINNEYLVINKTNNNYYTDIIKEKNYPNNKYTFTYLEDESLKNVKLNDEEIVSYEYDNKRLFRKKDIEGVTNYTYDINDNIKEINLKDKYKVKLEYDNLNNLEKQDITIQNKDKLSYSYLYDYEYNEYKVGGYFASLENSFKEDILYEDIKLKYNDSYGSNRVNLTLDEELNKKVIRFCYNNSYLSYYSRMINKDRIPFSLNNERYNTYDFVTEFYKHKEIYFWIKIDDFSASYGIVRLLTLSSSNEDIFKITIDADCNVTFNCLGTKEVLGKIKPNEWSLIGLSLKKINDNETSLIYVLNDQVKNETDEINEELKEIKKITFGPNTNSTLENSIPYSILFAGIGIYDHDKVSYNNIYYDGKRFINNNNSKKASGVIYYNNKTYKDFNVIPLNGSLLSQKGIIPIEYSIASPSYLNKKSKIFELDNITNRFVYGSYDEELGLNKSILSYNLYLKESGTISLRFKLKDVKTKSSRTILDIKNEDSHNMLAYIDFPTYELIIKVPYGASNEIIMNTGIIIEEEKWHLLTINYTLTSITIHLDDYTDSRNVSINLKDCKTYIGVQIDNINTINPLYGNIEMLSYGNIINNIHNSLKEAGQVISVIKEYDNNDRVSLKTIDTGKTKEQIEYKYYDKDLNINPLIKKEVFKDLEIIYSYDKHNNITNIVHLKNNEIIKEIHYDYDGYSRLIKETCFNQNVLEYCYEYKYNNFSDILEKIEYNVNEEIINKEEYVYNDSRLIKVIKNEEVKEITYTDDYFRPSTYKGNTLVWEGKRLKSYNDIEYTYNSEGIRIKKQTNNKTFEYIVINGKVIKEIRTDGKEIIYHYDETGQVVGFNYNSNEYFYIRDITGQINKILNVNGEIEVEYEYNSYGKVLKT